ncbi:hypothetical protein ACHAXS_008014 [Conticribra weissflogii]
MSSAATLPLAPPPDHPPESSSPKSITGNSRRISTPKSKSKTRTLTKTTCLLAVLGTLVCVLTIFSLSIGHYYHNQYADDLLSRMQGMADFQSSQSSLNGKASHDSLRTKSQQNAQGSSRGNGDSVAKKDEVTKQDADGSSKHDNENSVIISGNNDKSMLDASHERSVFQSIIDRVEWTKQLCAVIPSDQKNTLKNPFQPITDLPMLTEGGVGPTLQKWLRDNPLSSDENDKDANNDASKTYPTCHLPPSTSCNTSTYTLIMMSHTTARLHDFMNPLFVMMETWPGLTEVIIVWNSPRETLTSVAENTDIPTPNKKKADQNREIQEQQYASQLLQWHNNSTHPLRIFFSLENGLENNLLNRYHPLLQPKNEAIMYFDDDGPFWSKDAMITSGFELWKRNSDVQVGAFPRNIRYMSQRMKELGRHGVDSSIQAIASNARGVDLSPQTQSKHHHPLTFTPLCRNVTGDTVEYNYFVFPDFDAHVLLPSGTFLHRNFLCFVWHPAFEELRTYVVTHKTYPDDMTVSTLISHLSGRAPRTFPREIAEGVKNSSRNGRRLMMEYDRDERDENEAIENNNPNAVDQSHRRLLWKQKNWGKMREEAVNSLTGYFGSIHPGTVGWCAGTPYMKKRGRGVPYVCDPEKPTLDLIPWLQEGGPGFDHCPK